MGAMVTRQALIIATETALAATPNLTTIERLALRMVAATTESFMVGNFGRSGDGCPLTQAGIFPRICEDGNRDRDLDPFWRTFDEQVHRASFGPWSRSVTVIGN